MFRNPATQLAHRARLSLRTPASRAIPRLTARLPIAATSHRIRHFSSRPPLRRQESDEDCKRRPKKPSSNNGNSGDRESQSEGSEQPKEEHKLAEGFELPTEEEMRQLHRILDSAPPNMRGDVAKIMEYMQKVGIPVEMKELLRKQRTGGLSLIDGFKATRTIGKMAKEINRVLVEKDMNEKPDVDFYSNQPGQQKPRDAKQHEPTKSAQEQEGQKGQQEDKDKEGREEKNQEQQQQKQQNQQGGGGQRPRGEPEGRKIDMTEVVTWIIVSIIAYPLYSILMPGETSREITWQELRKNFLDKGLVEKLTVYERRVRVDLNKEAVRAMYPETNADKVSYYFSFGSMDALERRLDEAQKELGIPPDERIPVTYASDASWVGNMFFAFGPTLFFVGLLAFLSRRGGGVGGGASGMFGFGKSKAKMFNQDSAVKVKFADVAGMDEAKVEIMEFVSFLKTPERFQRLGAKIPRGAILSGPPGTGKTLLAKATAGESQVPFFTVSGSEFVEMFVGVGASRVRDLFATARRNAPCIIFIDEIDAVGRARSDGGFRGGGNDEREATLNQILTEMDGFNTAEQVVVLAGTNRPDVLDKALMRPGRFDRHIHIDRPTMAGRKDIFKVHLAKIVTDEEPEYLTGRLAALTPGFAGADIANAVNEAALIAARANAKTVSMIHFEQAIERVIGGLERKSLVLSPEEKRTVAYHEAGHAICGWFFRWADPLLKVSIIPRGQGALGYAQYLPSGDAYLMNTNQLMDRMAMTLGGRVSEELHFPTVTTGASDDFNKVTSMATTMVTQWGMSEKVGPLHFKNDPNQLHKPFAESTAQLIDSEVRRIVDQAYKQCKDLLIAKKKEIGIVAEELLRKEMLTRDDLVRLLGPREWPDKEEFSKYFNGGAREPPFGTENTDSPGDSGPQPTPAFDGEAVKKDGEVPPPTQPQV